MKFILLSDFHLVAQNPIARIDNLLVEQFKKFKFIWDYADEIDAHILQAGDFTDRPRSWHLLPLIVEMLRRYKIDFHAIFGQHDTYMYSEETRVNTNLGVLERAGLVEVLDKEVHYHTDIVNDNTCAIYGCHYGLEVPEVEDEDCLNILVIHAPIGRNELYPDQEYEEARGFLNKHNDYDLILCGDIHRKFHIEDKRRKGHLINTGCILRKTAEEYNFKYKPSFAVYDTEDRSIEWVEIPHKPAEEVLSRKHIEREIEINDMLGEFINEIEVEVELGDDPVIAIRRFIKKNKIKKSVENILVEMINKEK